MCLSIHCTVYSSEITLNLVGFTWTPETTDDRMVESEEILLMLAKQIVLWWSNQFGNPLLEQFLISFFSRLRAFPYQDYKEDLLIKADAPHGYNFDRYLSYSKLLVCMQRGGLVFLSHTILKIIHTTECLFRIKVWNLINRKKHGKTL